MGNVPSKSNQLRALKTGFGIQYILDEACKIMENPALAHDMEYKLYASARDVVTDDPIWNEYVATGTVSMETQTFFMTENFLDTAANAEKTVFLPSKRLKYQRIFGKLFNAEDIQIGAACLLAAYRPFDEGDYKLFEVLCEKLNAEFALDSHYTAYGQCYQEALINRLIEGSITDKAMYTPHVESIYHNMKKNLFVITADCSAIGTEMPTTRFLGMLKHVRRDFKYSIYGDYVVILVSNDKPRLDMKKDLRGLLEMFEKYSVKGGVSEVFDNLFELHKYYDQAFEALSEAIGENAAYKPIYGK